MNKEKIDSIKDKIKKLQEEAENVNRELKSKRELIDSLEEEITKLANSEYIDFCRHNLEGNYFYHTFTSDEYICECFIYANKVKPEHDEEDYRLYGKSFLHVYSNNGGVKGNLVTFTADNDSHYLITNGWQDSLAGYIAYDKLTKISEEEFKNAKKKINEIII